MEKISKEIDLSGEIDAVKAYFKSELSLIKSKLLEAKIGKVYFIAVGLTSLVMSDDSNK